MPFRMVTFFRTTSLYAWNPSITGNIARKTNWRSLGETKAKPWWGLWGPLEKVYLAPPPGGPSPPRPAKARGGGGGTWGKYAGNLKRDPQRLHAKLQKI